MLHVIFQNCRSSSFIEEWICLNICLQVLTKDARRTHWYCNSSLWPFWPGELKSVKDAFTKYFRCTGLTDWWTEIKHNNPLEKVAKNKTPSSAVWKSHNFQSYNNLERDTDILTLLWMKKLPFHFKIKQIWDFQMITVESIKLFSPDNMIF